MSEVAHATPPLQENCRAEKPAKYGKRIAFLRALPTQCCGSTIVPGGNTGDNSGGPSGRGVLFLSSLLVIWLLYCESNSRNKWPVRHPRRQFAKLRPSTTVESARSVRKNPKDSRLVKLRARKDVERQDVSSDSGPR